MVQSCTELYGVVQSRTELYGVVRYIVYRVVQWYSGIQSCTYGVESYRVVRSGT